MNNFIKFRMVRSFFIRRILFFGILGILVYTFFALQQFTILEAFPNLWAVIVTSMGGFFFAIASYYLSRYRTFGKLDDFLMGQIDDACNTLIDADDPKKFEPRGNMYTPRLLVSQVHKFGEEILETFCRKEVFQLVEGGIFGIKDRLLPDHPYAYYPKDLKDNLKPRLYELINAYLKDYPEEISILLTKKITDKRFRLTKIVDVDNQEIKNFNKSEVKNLVETEVELPFPKAIITPITMNEVNIGFLILFYHSQSFWSSIINPKEMIDNYMLKKIEDWKLDDVIKSIINKERLLLSFFLEKSIDNVITPAIQLIRNKKVNKEEQFEVRSKEILEIICNIMKIDRGGFIFVQKGDKLITLENNIDHHLLHRNIIPYILTLISTNKRKVSNFNIREIPNFPRDVDFQNIMYVNIENDQRNLGLLGLFATRDFDEFDKMILSIIEDIELDDFFLLFQED